MILCMRTLYILFCFHITKHNNKYFTLDFDYKLFFLERITRQYCLQQKTISSASYCHLSIPAKQVRCFPCPCPPQTYTSPHNLVLVWRWLST